VIRVSPTNLVATATVSASSQDDTYPAVNILTPHQPTLPARTTVITDSWWVLDLGSALPVTVVGLIGTNFTSVVVQANGADTWGAPTYTSGTLAVGRNPAHGRRHLCHQPAATVTQRYWRLFVPAQTPTDGAAYFRLGGIHLGTQVLPLEDVLVSYTLHTDEAWLDVQPFTQGYRTRARLHEAVARLTLNRRTALGTVPGVADDYAAWQAVEWAWHLTDYALVSLRDDLTSWCWIMHRLSVPAWALSSKIGDATLELEEVIR
jgi:hypothetical protein